MEALDDELICAVCRDIFVDPLTLPCGHNYCENCVSQLKRSAVAENESDEGVYTVSQFYTCPLCLAPCDSKINLKKNVVLHNIIEKYHRRRASTIDCSVCKGELKAAAEKSCVNCNESYCAAHVMPHFENSTLRKHVLVSPMSDAGRLCKEHGKDLELFCETDSAPLCAYCMLPSEAKHGSAGHSVVKLADALKGLRRDCHVKLDGIAQSLSEVQDSLKEMELDTLCAEESLLEQQREYSAFMSRVRLFLDLEEKAWKKRFAVDLVQVNRGGRHRSERLRRLQTRLSQAQRALLEAQSIHDPLVVLQLLQNADWADLFQRSVCSSQIQEFGKQSLPQPEGSARLSPLFKTLQTVFPGDQIYLHQPTAHPSLHLSPDRASVWTAPEDGDDPTGAPLCVLGAAALRDGVHHWEVSVGGLSSWAVGVAYVHPGGVPLTQELGGDGQSWGLSYDQSRRQFCARHDWLTFSFGAPDGRPPTRIGVFLDMDSGILCFYDAAQLESLYTFYCSLGRADCCLYPAFCPRVRGDCLPTSRQAMRLLCSASEF